MIPLLEKRPLPLDAVTQKVAILGMSGSGKSYGLTKAAEGILDAKAQLVMLDPKGEAWGLRLMADGERPGYKIPVFGGDHADVPLKPSMGKEIADLIVNDAYSAVLDVSEFTSQEIGEFCYHFATQLLHLKKRKPGAMCLMLDEAEEFVPQNPSEKGWEPKMLHAFERLQKQGRAKGVGFWVCGQRPQEINKKILNLSEAWIMFRQGGLQERETTKKLIGQRDKEYVDTLDHELPRLDTGMALVWSPWWLKIKGQFKILPKKTYDSSATPEVGASIVPARELTKIDIEKLSTAMASAIAEVEANDPKKLQSRIAVLEKELALKNELLENAPKETEKVEVEVPIFPQALRDDLDALVRDIAGKVRNVQISLESLEGTIVERWTAFVEKHSNLASAVKTVPGIAEFMMKTPAGTFHDVPRARPSRPAAAPQPRTAAGDLKISPTQQRILDALAFYESIGNNSPSLVQIGAVALLDATGGHFSNTVGPLSSNGLVVRAHGAMSLTDAGRAYASAAEAPTSLTGYHNVLRSRVRKMKSASGRTVDILDTLIAAGGRALTNEEIGQAIGIDHTGGHFSNTIGPLSTAGLITRSGGLVHPTSVLFPEGLS